MAQVWAEVSRFSSKNGLKTLFSPFILTLDRLSPSVP